MPFRDQAVSKGRPTDLVHNGGGADRRSHGVHSGAQRHGARFALALGGGAPVHKGLGWLWLGPGGPKRLRGGPGRYSEADFGLLAST